MVFFAYEMIEFVGVTVSETQNPRKVLAKAINEIIVRVLVFYVGALVAIMLIVPWRTFKPLPDGSFTSPFVMVFRYAGLDWAAALVFFVVITAAASALNSLLYSAGRNLSELANTSQSPLLHSLSRISRRGHVPARAIVFSGILIMLSPVVHTLPGLSSAFILFASASSAVIIFIYILLMVSHRRYRQSTDFMADGFVMPAYKWTGTVTILFFVVICVSLFLAPDTRISAICGLVWLFGFGGICSWKHRQSL